MIAKRISVVFHPAAVEERAALEPRERVAVDNVIEKLHVVGIGLGSPHSSAVRGGSKLRELRPRAGKSRTRAFYARVGDAFVIAAIGPEADADPHGFKHAVAIAQERLAEIVPARTTPTQAARPRRTKKGSRR